MYSVGKKSKRKRRKKFYVNGESVSSILGFVMNSKKCYLINDMNILNIKVVNKTLARPLVVKKVSLKFDKLINLLTELIISDDDSGDTFREALNQIEKFRLEVKNKYRMFLEQKELEEMSKKLKLLKKTSEDKLVEINHVASLSRSTGKGR